MAINSRETSGWKSTSEGGVQTTSMGRSEGLQESIMMQCTGLGRQTPLAAHPSSASKAEGGWLQVWDETTECLTQEALSTGPFPPSCWAPKSHVRVPAARGPTKAMCLWVSNIPSPPPGHWQQSWKTFKWPGKWKQNKPPKKRFSVQTSWCPLSTFHFFGR